MGLRDLCQAIHEVYTQGDIAQQQAMRAKDGRLFLAHLLRNAGGDHPSPRCSSRAPS